MNPVDDTNSDTGNKTSCYNLTSRLPMISNKFAARDVY